MLMSYRMLDATEHKGQSRGQYHSLVMCAPISYMQSLLLLIVYCTCYTPNPLPWAKSDAKETINALALG